MRVSVTCSRCAPPARCSTRPCCRRSEYAVSSLHVSLLVVLSHQHCAAVAQAEKELDALTEHLTHEITDAQERERIMEDLERGDRIIVERNS